MKDYLSIGTTPYDEPCVQVGTEEYNKFYKVEAQTFINQLKREFGEPPFNCSLRIKSFPHDFGTYHEVVCYFDDNDPESINYAFKLESECPQNWDEKAIKELENLGYSFD